jgi:hypothetical protein
MLFYGTKVINHQERRKLLIKKNGRKQRSKHKTNQTWLVFQGAFEGEKV